MTAYYNEHDPFAAAWLRELIAAGHIAPGDVDERSIELVRPADLAGFRQCHFFAGIGGWSYALRLAGWPDNRPVWSGSCPCQPFSSAGAQAGGDDPRDLWPTWIDLIRECRPPIVFGEQVAGAIGHGWFDRLCDDLEREGYAVGAACLPACSVGAFHIRQRLWFVADAEHAKRWAVDLNRQDERNRKDRGRSQAYREPGTCGPVRNGTLDLPASQRRERLGDPPTHGVALQTDAGELGNTKFEGLAFKRSQRRASSNQDDAKSWQAAQRAGASTIWANADWISCLDGKTRPVEPVYVAMADGLSGSLVPDGDSSQIRAGWPTPNSQENDMSPEQWELLNQKQKAANPRLHAKQKMLSTVAQYAQTQIDGDGRDSVRTVREDEVQAPCASQGSESLEQRSIELADFVRLLPSSLALAELRGDTTTTEALRTLLETSCAERLVQYPSHQVEAAWRSLGQEVQNRFRLEFGKGGFVRTVEHPLAHGVPARVGRLRGYGNAIVPQVAAAFIDAYLRIR